MKLNGENKFITSAITLHDVSITKLRLFEFFTSSMVMKIIATEFQLHSVYVSLK